MHHHGLESSLIYTCFSLQQHPRRAVTIFWQRHISTALLMKGWGKLSLLKCVMAHLSSFYGEVKWASVRRKATCVWDNCVSNVVRPMNSLRLLGHFCNFGRLFKWGVQSQSRVMRNDSPRSWLNLQTVTSVSNNTPLLCQLSTVSRSSVKWLSRAGWTRPRNTFVNHSIVTKMFPAKWCSQPRWAQTRGQTSSLPYAARRTERFSGRGMNLLVCLVGAGKGEGSGWSWLWWRWCIRASPNFLGATRLMSHSLDTFRVVKTSSPRCHMSPDGPCMPSSGIWMLLLRDSEMTTSGRHMQTWAV